MCTLDRSTCVRNRLSAFQVVQGFSAPAGICSSALMLRCMLVARARIVLPIAPCEQVLPSCWWAQCIWWSYSANKRSAYSLGHAQLCVCRRPCRHYTEHGRCLDRGNTDVSSRRSVGVLHHKPAPRESDKDTSQPLPPAESWMWQTAQHQLERGELHQLPPPGIYWRHTGPNVVV